MENILLVVNSDKAKENIVQMLKSNASYKISVSRNCCEASRALVDNIFDLVIINTPLPDEFGSELALNITESTSCGVLLIVKNDLVDEISQIVENAGVFVIGKPISKAMFFQTLKLVSAFHNRISNLKNENDVLKNKIQEIKLVDRAKCVLIEYLNMSENEAHKYIEKQAMNNRLTKVDIAKDILKTYDSKVN